VAAIASSAVPAAPALPAGPTGAAAATPQEVDASHAVARELGDRANLAFGFHSAVSRPPLVAWFAAAALLVMLVVIVLLSR
jgi:hypothetical protein